MAPLAPVCSLTSSHVIAKRNLTLDASSLASGVTLIAPPSQRHFNISSRGWLTASKVTFSGGRITGTVAVFGGSLYFANGGSGVLSSCRFTNNTVIVVSGLADAGGGAIYLEGRGSLRMSSCQLSGNHAVTPGSALGGALHVAGGVALTLWQNTFASNSVQVWPTHRHRVIT